MEFLAKFVHGSHLYKLNTPASDTDFKGVHVPSLDDLLLCDATHHINLGTDKKSGSKNTKDDVDFESYSIHKWVDLLSKGEMVCFDMLFAPEDCVEYYHKGEVTTDPALLERNPVWIIRNRYKDLFVHSDMKAYLGYCRRQASKYGIKGSRLHSLFEIQGVLENLDIRRKDRLYNYVEKLPTNEYLKLEDDHYEVLGKKHQLTTYMEEFCDRITAEINKYGNRAVQAEKNEGVDWKAVSHAFRAGYQIQSMLYTGEMFVVLPDEIRKYVLKLKKGELDWTTEVKPNLEKLMNIVELIARENPLDLPEKPDKGVIQEKLLEILKDFNNIS
ncbi:MAG: hypothetical protein GOVbin4162_13 [Prokaryotic dsDNA virus sp.]|nr:MAG: hypothetical protein GOVbin4162_13 [Prokaryotic dsDNA virus sp.]|tara:strand:- start:1131 stop:2117 length:987 start_codon:yes stop_codon:yes gene_type:complete